MQRQYLRQGIVFISAGLFFALFPGVVFAQQSSPDALQMLVNLSRIYPQIWRLVTALCYVVGFSMAVRGVYYLKQYGELRTMMASQTSLKVPIVFFIVAAIFIYLPTGFSIVNKTVFGTSSILSYPGSSGGASQLAVNAVGGLISLVGLISFIRGWLILVAHTQQPGGQATLGKALTHIIGGLFAINIFGVVGILANTFGFNNPFT